MALLQSSLLHGTLNKSVATRQYFYKISNYLQKAQIIFWHLFTKAQILFWHLFTKAEYYIGNYLQKPNIILKSFIKKPKTIGQTIILLKPKYYLAKIITLCSKPKTQNYSLAKTYFHILKSLTHGKHKLLMIHCSSFKTNYTTKFMGTILILP